MVRRALQVLTSPVDIEMWGDGKQTRSFTFIDDCVEGILRITKSDFKEPLNLGSSEMVRSCGLSVFDRLLHLVFCDALCVISVLTRSGEQCHSARQSLIGVPLLGCATF